MRTRNRLLATMASACTAGLLLAGCHDDASTLAGPTQVRTLASRSPGVAYADSQLVAYVANRGSNFVSVLYSGEEVARIPVGKWPVDVAMGSGGDTYGRLYVTNQGSNSVSVVNMLTNRVEMTIPVGSYPHGVATSWSEVFVANQESNTLSVIDAVAGKVVATIPVGKWPYGVAYANANHVYVANYHSNTVSVIDAGSRAVVATVPVGLRPVKIAVADLPTPTAYVTNEGSNTVSVVDLTANAVVATIPVGVWPNGIEAGDFGSFDSYIFVANVYGGSVSVIDPWTNTVVRTRTGLVQPIDVAVACCRSSYDWGSAFVSNQSIGAVSVADLRFAGVAKVEVGDTPWGVTAHLWVSPPKAHQPPPFGGSPGNADKDFVEVCNAYTDGTAPAVRVRVIADGADSTFMLPEGTCRDVWYNPLSRLSRVEVMQEPPSGYYPTCYVTQVGPRDQLHPADFCPETWRAVVQSSLDVGYLVQFRNWRI